MRNASKSFYVYAMSRARIIAKNKNTYIIHIFPYNNTHFLLLCVRLYYMLFACVRAYILYVLRFSLLIHAHRGCDGVEKQFFFCFCLFFLFKSRLYILYYMIIYIARGIWFLKRKGKWLKKMSTLLHTYTQTDRPRAMSKK